MRRTPERQCFVIEHAHCAELPTDRLAQLTNCSYLDPPAELSYSNMIDNVRNLRQRSVQSALSPVQGSKWTNDEHLQLVAWMAHCQKRDASGSLFRRTVVNHLQRQFHKLFSFLQVDEKIKRMWKGFVAKRGKNYAQLNMSHTTLYEGHPAISFTQYLVEGRQNYKDVQRRILDAEHERDSLSINSRTNRDTLNGISSIVHLRQRYTPDATEDQRKRANYKRSQRRQRRRVCCPSQQTKLIFTDSQ